MGQTEARGCPEQLGRCTLAMGTLRLRVPHSRPRSWWVGGPSVVSPSPMRRCQGWVWGRAARSSLARAQAPRWIACVALGCTSLNLSFPLHRVGASAAACRPPTQESCEDHGASVSTVRDTRRARPRPRTRSPRTFPAPPVPCSRTQPEGRVPSPVQSTGSTSHFRAGGGTASPP